MKYDPPFQHTSGFWPVLIVFACLALAPLVLTETYTRHVLILVFVFAVIATNWDVSLGLGGIFNFAHLAFFAIGLYSYAILAKVVGVDPWLSMAIAPVFAVAFAACLAVPILRLDGVYVILVTIAAAQLLLQVVVSQSSVTGGTGGMVLLPHLKLAGERLSSNNRLGFYYLGLALLLASTWFVYKLERSSIGRAMKAMRDNKYFAIARGVSEARMRLVTLCLSAIFPALAGGFYGAYLRVASPDVFGLSFLTLSLSILLLGGVATLWGPIIAAFVVVGLSQALADFGAWRDIVIALAIIGVIAVYPGGLFAVLQELRHQLDRAYTAWRARWVRQSTASDRARLMGVPDRLIQTRHGAISVSDTERGDQAVVMVHGNSSCKEVFHHQFAALRDRYRVVAFDLPGHGVSANGAAERDYNLDAYASILAELVDRLHLGSPVVVGWSLGGYVALEYAAAGHPIAGLVITGTSPIGQYPEDMPKGYIPTPHMELAGKRFHSRHEKAQYATHTTGLARADTPFAWQAVYRCDGEARKRAFAAFKTVDWPRQLALWRTEPLPIAMLNGRSDPFINHEYCDRQCEGASGLVTNHPFVDVGHAPFLEAPTAFNAVLEQVLADCLSKQQATLDKPLG